MRWWWHDNGCYDVNHWAQKLFLACRTKCLAGLQPSARHFEPLPDIFPVDDWLRPVVIFVFVSDILCVSNPAGQNQQKSAGHVRHISRSLMHDHQVAIFLAFCVLYIVVCQRGGVSNEPPRLQAATRHLARDPLVRSQVDKTWQLSNNYLYKKFKKKNGPYIRPVLLRQGEPGTSQYVCTCQLGMVDNYKHLFFR